MNKLSKILFILLGFYLLTFALEVDYGITAGFLYDSNIGQNITEKGKGYFVPEGYLKLKGDKLYFKVSSVYENYLSERSPVLNSPFLSLAGGAVLKKGDFRYNSEIRTALYYGQSVQGRLDDNSEPTSWAPAKYSYRWYNNFQVNRNPNRYLFKTQMQVNNYGDPGKDGFRLILEPEYQYRFSVKKSDPVKVKYVSLMTEYEGNFVVRDIYSYNYWGIGTGVDLKLGETSLFTSVTYASKSYWGEIEHPISGEMIFVKNRYFYTYGSYSVPIVADLKIQIHGKLRFKNSTNPGYDWNRHTVGIKLSWNSTVGKYRKE